MTISSYLLLAIGLLSAGCTQVPILYVPPPAHHPVSNAEGKADASLMAGSYGYSARASWSPMEHLELFGLATHHDKRSDSVAHAFNSYQEAGVGWYTTAGISVKLSLIAGFGLGYATGFGGELLSGERVPMYEASGSYNRTFAGVALGYAGGNDSTGIFARQEFGLTVRVARVAFATISGQRGTESGDGWFIEPVFVSRFGSPEIQIEAQTGYNSVYSSAGIRTVDVYGRFGIHLQLDRLF